MMEKVNKVILKLPTLMCMLISSLTIVLIIIDIFNAQQIIYSASYYFIWQCILILVISISLKRFYKINEILMISYIGMFFSLLILVATGFLKLLKNTFTLKEYLDYMYFPSFTMFISLALVGSVIPFLKTNSLSKNISIIHKITIIGVIYMILIVIFFFEIKLNIKF